MRKIAKTLIAGAIAGTALAAGTAVINTVLG